jgi:hypothetical protein
MNLTTLSTLCTFFLAFIAPAMTRTDIHHHQPPSRLEARTPTSSPNTIDLTYGTIRSAIVLEVVGFDDSLRPICSKSAHKDWQCEFACRCATNGRLRCGTALPFNRFRHWGRHVPLSQEQSNIMQAKLVSECAPACSCSHIPNGYEAGRSGERSHQTGEALSAGAGPSRNWRSEIPGRSSGYY